MEDSARVEMNDSVSDPQEELAVAPTLRTKFTAKEVWNALEVVQKRHRKYMVPVLLKLQRIPPDTLDKIFDAISDPTRTVAESSSLAGELRLTDADVSFIVSVINYIKSE